MSKTGVGRFGKSVAAALLAAVVGLSCFALSGCTGKKMTVAEMTETLGVENLASKADVRTDTGDDALPYTDSDYGSVDFTFPTEISFNAVALSERSSSVEDFEILVESGGKWSQIYRQDFIREFRYCVFPRIRASAVKMRFQSGSGEFTISEVGIYDAPASERDFRTVSYLRAEAFLDYEAFDAGQGIESFGSVTDVILTGAAAFRSDGTLEISDGLETALANLKRVELALSKRFDIYCEFSNSEKEFGLGNFDEVSDQYVTAMKNNGETLSSNLVAFMNDNAFDGVSFDWEFPRRNSDWRVFSKFLTGLRGISAPGRKLAVAVSGSRGVSFTDSAVEAVDLFLSASYDRLDAPESRASFLFAVEDAAKLEAIGIPRRKICAGIPFYAVETEGDRLFAYKVEAGDLGRDYNIIRNPIALEDGKVYEGKRFYNGYCMARDKTAFAYDTGMGGVALRCHTQDADYDAAVNGKPVSLLRAVGETLSFRK